MKIRYSHSQRRFLVAGPVLALWALCGIAPAAETLLNGTQTSSVAGFTTFLDQTEPGSRAWSFRNDTLPMAPIKTGGALSTVTPVAILTSGGSNVTFGAGTLFATVGGYNWPGQPDQTARDAMANGAGFHSLTTIDIGPVAAVPGATYHIELLAISAFASLRSFDITANGVERVDNWAIMEGGNYNHVLEFDVVADAAGIHLVITGGADGDGNPYLSAMALTPLPPDTDADGLPDSFEQLIIDADPGDLIASFADVLPGGDFDSDASTNQEEFQIKTNPTDNDSDNDGLFDGYEIGAIWVSATSTGSNPLVGDTDGDGLSDGVENPDLPFLSAAQPGTDPTLWDTDSDLLDDKWEIDNHFDPTDDTGENGTFGDPDEDNLSNEEEQDLGTDPRDADTDNDGLNDIFETNHGYDSYLDQTDTGTDPRNPDTDRDGLSDRVENPVLPFVNAGQPGTDPTKSDTDEDGFSDSTEIAAGTDPTDIDEFPASPLVVSRWGFDDNLTDTATAGTTADLLADHAGGVTYVPGVVGKAVAITTGRLTAASSADLHLTGSWTMEAFIWRDLNNLQTHTWERFWTKWGSIGGTEYHWSIRGDNFAAVPDGLDLYANNAQVINNDTTTQTIPFEKWVHVALVGNHVAGTIRAFVNGIDVGGAAYVAITPTSQHMNFGNFETGEGMQFSGYIDDAMIHEGAVSQTYLQARASLLPSETNYAAWIGGFTFAPDADQTPTGDPDHDGLANSVEMVVGGNPASRVDAALMPTLELVNADLGTGNTDYFLFTYRRSDASVIAGVTSAAETALDLIGPWTAAQDGVAGVVVRVDDNFAWTNPVAAATDRVRVYVPRAGNPKVFGRLKVVVP